MPNTTRRKSIAVRINRIAPAIKGIQLFQPGFLVWRKDRERATAFCKNFFLLKNGLVLVRMQCAMNLLQTASYLFVAVLCLRLIVVICIDRLRTDSSSKRRNNFPGPAAQHLQCSTQFFERLRQLFQTQPYEFNAPVTPVGQDVQNFAIEDKDTLHVSRLFERMVQRGVVVTAQIPPKPYQGRFVALRHLKSHAARAEEPVVRGKSTIIVMY